MLNTNHTYYKSKIIKIIDQWFEGAITSIDAIANIALIMSERNIEVEIGERDIKELGL